MSMFLGWVFGIGLHVVGHILHDILNFHKIIIMHKSAQFDVTHISFNSLFFAIVVATLLFYTILPYRVFVGLLLLLIFFFCRLRCWLYILFNFKSCCVIWLITAVVSITLALASTDLCSYLKKQQHTYNIDLVEHLNWIVATIASTPPLTTTATTTTTFLTLQTMK